MEPKTKIKNGTNSKDPDDGKNEEEPLTKTKVGCHQFRILRAMA